MHILTIEELLNIREYSEPPFANTFSICPPSEGLIRRINAILLLIPSDYPRPDISLEIDGCVCLDWVNGDTRDRASWSIGESGKIEFNCHATTVRAYGAVDFDGALINPLLLALIKSVNN